MGLETTSDFLIGAAIGSGNTALAAERAGADFLLAINAGRLRTMGAPSIACMLPIADATSLTETFAVEELLPQCRIPVLLGVNVWGDTFDPDGVAQRLCETGFAGAVNFPSGMHYSAAMQRLLARAGRGIEQEIEQLHAVQQRGLKAMFYCATRDQARLAADAGIGLICLNLGWNVGGSLGHRQRASLEEVATMAREIGRLIKRINGNARFLLEGGPIGTAEDLGRIIRLAPVDGYVGGSTFERTPLETSVADQIDRFRQAGRHGADLDAESASLVKWAGRIGFVGRSQAQLAYLRRLRAVAGTTGPVLVEAERGLDTRPTITALSQAVHAPQPDTVVHIDITGEDYPARARGLLFGHRDSIGRRPPALGDSEIGLLVIHAPERLPIPTQRRLARALRDGVFRVSGQWRSMPIVPRAVLVSEVPSSDGEATTMLASIGLDPSLVDVTEGQLLRVPPLRERIDDLLTVLETCDEAALCERSVRSVFSSMAIQQLAAHRWPGNDSELRTLMGTLAGRLRGAHPIDADELVPLLDPARVPAIDPRSEKDRVIDALWRNGFNRSRTAEALGMSRKTLYNKIKKYGLKG